MTLLQTTVPQQVEISFNPFVIMLILLCAALLFLGMVQVTKPYRKKRKARRHKRHVNDLEKDLLS